MKRWTCGLMCILLLSVTACGIRRDLKLPQDGKHGEHSSDVQPAANPMPLE